MGFGRSIGTMMPGVAGMLGMGTVSAAVGSVTSKATEIRNLTRQYGLTADTIQRLGFAAKQTGGNLDEMLRIYARIQERQEKARIGQKEATRGFAAIGLDPNKVAKMGPMELFEAVADAARTATTGQMMMLMPEMGPRLQRAARQDIPALMANAPTMTAEQVEELATAADDLTTEFERMGVTMAGPVLEAVRNLRKGIDVVASAYRASGLEKLRQGYINAQGGAAGSLWGGLSTMDNSIGRFFRELISENRRIADAVTRED
jgi:hypothetical protein